MKKSKEDLYCGVTLFDCDLGDLVAAADEDGENEGHFVLTLGLKYNEPIRRRLDKMFAAANWLYNALVAEKKHDLDVLFETSEWKDNQSTISGLFEDNEGNSRSKSDFSKDETKLLNTLYKRRSKMLRDAGFAGEFDFNNAIKKHRQQFGYTKGKGIQSSLVPSNVCYGIACEVWKKFNDMLYGKGKSISFRKLEDCRSLDPACANTFVFDGKSLILSTKGCSTKKSNANRKRITDSRKTNKVAIEEGCGYADHGRFVIPVKFKHSAYEDAALANWQEKICHCRIVRIPWKDGWLYKLQILLKGRPPKQLNEDGQLKYPIGKGRVGIDIGPRTVAIVGDDYAEITELAPSMKDLHKAIRKLQQQMSRSRRVTNPEMFEPDGQIVRIDKLVKEHPECVRVINPDSDNPRYKRIWRKSKHYVEMEKRLRYLYGRAARSRVSQHNEMANRFIGMGDEFYIEKMNWKGLQRKAAHKEGDKPNKRRKRFGKSIHNKAPATFVGTVKQKVEKQGGMFSEVNTVACKASQYNHVTGEYVKPKLKDRAKNVGDHYVQRDLYSAFLLQNTNGHLDGFVQEQLEEKFENFLELQETAMEMVPADAPKSIGKTDWMMNQ